MKALYLTCTLFMLACVSYAKNSCPTDTLPKKDSTTLTSVDIEPRYPGGVTAFNKAIIKNLRYPEVANLIGINGDVYVSFVVDSDGKVTHVTPVKCLGAGCESEAVRAISLLKPWSPGTMNGRPVRVWYTIPISFNANKESVSMREFRNSDYGFVFYIKQTYYTIDEAQAILGKTIKSDRVAIAEPFDNTNNDPKFYMPDKKEVYLIAIKD